MTEQETQKERWQILWQALKAATPFNSEIEFEDFYEAGATMFDLYIKGINTTQTVINNAIGFNIQ